MQPLDGYDQLSPLDSWLNHVTVRVNPNSDTEAPRVKSTAGIGVHQCSALNTFYMGMRFFISIKLKLQGECMRVRPSFSKPHKHT